MDRHAKRWKAGVLALAAGAALCAGAVWALQGELGVTRYELPLPEGLEYSAIQGLRLEARQKLDQIRPQNLGQASRVSGVSPADVAVLMVYLKQNGGG